METSLVTIIGEVTALVTALTLLIKAITKLIIVIKEKPQHYEGKHRKR